MAIVSGASWTIQPLSVAAVVMLGIMLGIVASANSALAENSRQVQGQETGSGALPPLVQSVKSERKPMRKDPDRSGSFVYGIINQIRAQSEELCARYGASDDCLEEAEVCLTMRDTEQNLVRMCLNSVPRETKGGEGTTQRLRVRR